MQHAISDLSILLASMTPVLDDRAVAFVIVPEGGLAAIAPDAVIGTFREREGLTAIVTLAAAERLALPVTFRAAWITLSVHSDLAAVGLTAAVATTLAAAGISCNVVAAVYHDHLFVPLADATRALHALQELQQRQQKTQDPTSAGHVLS